MNDPSNIIDEKETIKRIIYAIINQAIESSVTEIQIEPVEHSCRVSYRVGEELQKMDLLPLYIHKSLVIQFKQMADIDPDNIKSQNGKIQIKYKEKDYSILVSAASSRSVETILLKFNE